MPSLFTTWADPEGVAEGPDPPPLPLENLILL